MRISRPLIPVLKLLITILLLFLVFQSIDISKISKDLSGFNWRSMVLLLIVCWLGQRLCSERWRILAASLKMHGRYRSFVQMYFAGMFFNIGLPSLIGVPRNAGLCISLATSALLLLCNLAGMVFLPGIPS